MDVFWLTVYIPVYIAVLPAERHCPTKIPELLSISFLANVNSRSRSLYVIVRPSVVCLSSVTFVHPTQTIEIFGSVSMLFGTLAIRDISVKILRISSLRNPSVGGVKHKRGSRI